MPHDTLEESLEARAVRSLRKCLEETGQVPSAVSYRAWRDLIPPADRKGIPSSTAIVPYSWRTWNEARVAAGISEEQAARSLNGPKPKWTADECLDWVVQWVHSGEGKSLAAFTQWIDARRKEGKRAPSVATIRLRIGRPWSQIVAEAQGRASA